MITNNVTKHQVKIHACMSVKSISGQVFCVTIEVQGQLDLNRSAIARK
jgi:hypothetical protein